MCAPVDERAPGAFDEDSIPFEQNKKQAVGLLFALVDSKGIEPSNLTDANRALSQVGQKYCYNTDEIVSKNTEK